MDIEKAIAPRKASNCIENHLCGLKSSLPNFSGASSKTCESNSKEKTNCKLKNFSSLEITDNESKPESLSKNPDLHVSDNLEVIVSKGRRDDQSTKRSKSLPLNHSNSKGRKSMNKSKFMAHSGISFIPSPSQITSNPFKPRENEECSKPVSLISGRKSTGTTSLLSNHKDISSQLFEKTESRKTVSALRKSIDMIEIDSKIFPVQYHTGHTGLIFKRKQQKRNSMNPFEQNITT